MICCVSNDYLLSSSLLVSSVRFFFASLLFFFSGHPTITPSFPLPFASRIARELLVNRSGGNPISSVQFTCSRAVPALRLVPAGYHVALLPLPYLSCLLLLLQVRPLNLGGARMGKASALSPSSVAGFCFAAEILFCLRSLAWMSVRFFI